ncbi:hypothetical protein [Halorubrum sp. FL23]|uniref:hypothetical protein n=1 Tax=Halorubrum sp. FL23 TaxID=3458704 RepID=UPI004033A156
MSFDTLFYIPQVGMNELDLDGEGEDDTNEEEDSYPEYSENMIRESFVTVQDFNKYLDKYFFTLTNKNHPKYDWTGSPGTDLHMLAGVTDLSRDDLIEGLADSTELNWDEEVEYGPGVTLLIDDKSTGTGAYLAHNAYEPKQTEIEQAEQIEFDDEEAVFGKQNGVFILYSNLPKKSYIDDPLLTRLRKVERTSQLHVSSRHLVDVIDEYVNNMESQLGEPPKCSEIIFKRPRGSSVDSKVGMSTKRTINYYGDDAATVVDHLTEHLGVHVDSVDFELKSLKFKINRDAVIKLKSGWRNENGENGGPISRLLNNILTKIVEETVGMKNAYANAESDTRSILGGEVSVSQPAVVRFDSPIEVTDIEAVFDQLAANGIVPVDRYTESEPLYYATSMYHRRYQEYFDIRGDCDSLRLFPRDNERNIESLFRLFDTLQTRIEPNVEVTSHDMNLSEESL